MQAPGDHCGFGIELCFPSRPPFLDVSTEGACMPFVNTAPYGTQCDHRNITTFMVMSFIFFSLFNLLLRSSPHPPLSLAVIMSVMHQIVDRVPLKAKEELGLTANQRRSDFLNLLVNDQFAYGQGTYQTMMVPYIEIVYGL
ncbi:hypothetical protein MG293_009958 [Ovis ammon polii]|uniref:Uncharacterized protein n=1 Tax=Ovis ammon polii TaxID=230172 RepID=A0AAD4Y9F3_OVIAM|nr:hypothetical protein MG293_009958 [Ovis ammon polii]